VVGLAARCFASNEQEIRPTSPLQEGRSVYAAGDLTRVSAFGDGAIATYDKRSKDGHIKRLPRPKEMSVEAGTFLDMIITCESCAVRDIGCDDCILTFFISKVDAKTNGNADTKSESAAVAIEIPDSTAEAIDLLSSRGIIRPLRFNSA
jgi:hypothetical protein